jgi:hypothetical protein
VENTDLYPTIFKRKSIRRYEPTSLDEATLAKITDRLNQLKPLNDDIEIELKILPANSVNGLFAAKAPHYLALFSEEKEGYLTNAGYLLQQMDLYLSGNGVGSCWLVAAKPSREYTKDSRLKFVISLAFGKPAEPLHRAGVGEFKRNTLDQIREAKGLDNLLEPARLAPSANNSQRWYFTGDEKRLNVYMSNSLILNRISMIDAGIAICHIWIAAGHMGKQVEYFKDEEAARNRPGGRNYVTSMRIS